MIYGEKLKALEEALMPVVTSRSNHATGFRISAASDNSGTPSQTGVLLRRWWWPSPGQGGTGGVPPGHSNEYGFFIE